MRINMVHVLVVHLLDVPDCLGILSFKVKVHDPNLTTALYRLIHDKVHQHRRVLAAAERNISAFALSERLTDAPPCGL